MQQSVGTSPNDDDIINGLCTWNGLPDVAIKKIFEKLQTWDRVRLRLVSKSWNQILTRDVIPTAPETPWLIKSCDWYYGDDEPNSFSTQIHIEDVIRQKTYLFRLPDQLLCKSRGGWWCCGSSRGWILIATSCSSLNTNLFLWNPLSSATRTLPSLSTLPFFNKLFRNDVGVKKFVKSIKRVEVFSMSNDDQCIVAAIFSNCLGGEEHLAFCTPQEESWCLLQGNYKYEDILFHNGKLYALAHEVNRDFVEGHQDGTSSEANYSIRLPTLDCEVKVIVSCLVYKIDNLYRDIYSHELDNPTFDTKYEDYFIEHLVEYSSTQMVVVTAVYDTYVFNSNGGGPVEAFKCHQINRFEVRKYPELERVMGNIGGKEIYVGSMGSLCIPENVEGMIANRILFFTDDAVGVVGENKDKYFVSGEIGTYDAEQNETSPPWVGFLPCPLQSRIGWLTPKLF